MAHMPLFLQAYSRMVKVLICGDMTDDWQLLLNRLHELQSSSVHGPFDLLLLIGKCYVEFIKAFQNNGENLPISIIIFQSKGLTADISTWPNRPKNLQIMAHSQSSVGLNGPESIKTIGNSNYCNIITLPDYKITIAYMNIQNTQSIENYETSSDWERCRDITTSIGYRGCDMLITNEWPKDMHYFISEAEYNELKSSNIGIGSGSKIISTFAAMVKPRYHFVPGKKYFFQRSPYRNDSNNTAPAPCTRLISIDQVSESKEKNKKWLHALSLSPIVTMDLKELLEFPVGTTECPYIDTNTTIKSYSSTTNKRMKLPSEPINKGSFFFESNASTTTSTRTSATDTCKTLFIGGLSRDTSEIELKNALPNAIYVKRPAGKAFAFVEFNSHLNAQRVFDAASAKGLVIQGRTLTVGWGKEKDNKLPSSTESSSDPVVHERQLIPPSSEAKLLFIGGLPPKYAPVQISSPVDTAPPDHVDEDNLLTNLQKLCPGLVQIHKKANQLYCFAEFESYEMAMALVTQSTHEKIMLDHHSLLIGWAKDNALADDNTTTTKRKRDDLTLSAPNYDSKVLFIGGLPTATRDEDISNLFSASYSVESIKRPVGKDYAFIEFNTPNDARNVWNDLNDKNESLTIDGQVLKLGWAKGRPADKFSESTDCWFCLASPMVKFHLIVSVGEFTYLALPRGGVNNFHCIISPIECIPSRIHFTEDTKKELEKFQKGIDDMYNKQGNVSLRFERALRTKGNRDHMQIHFIPIPQPILSRILKVFINLSSELNIKFHEIEGDVSVDEVVLIMEGGPFQEYFYIEIPVSYNSPTCKNVDTSSQKMVNHHQTATIFRRFVYVKDDIDERTPRMKFPMQFGAELAANVLNAPERAHWKNCVLASEKLEIELVDKFREAFAPYDFTAVEE